MQQSRLGGWQHCAPAASNRHWVHRKSRLLITDKLRSYAAAKREIMPGVEHRQHKGLNNRAENSHQPTPRRERIMKRFKSPRQVQRFLSIHDQIANVFTRRLNQDTATKFRIARGQAFTTWAEITCVVMAA
jgi:putative transposase